MANDKKVTAIFTSGDERWSESYALTSVAQKIQAKQFAVNMLKQRLKLCGRGVQLRGFRITEFPSDGTVMIVLPSEGLWQNPPAIVGTETGIENEQATTVVLLSCLGNKSASPERPLSGAPDGLHSETAADGLRADSFPQWKIDFDKWRAILLSLLGVTEAGPWGFVSVKPDGEATPLSILGGQLDGSYLAVEVGGDQTAVYTVGTKVRVKKNRRVSPIFKGPNGSWVVSAVALMTGGAKTLITLQGAEGIDVAKWKPGSYGIIVKTIFEVQTFVDVKINRTSIRKRRSGGFFTTPGRGKRPALITS